MIIESSKRYRHLQAARGNITCGQTEGLASPPPRLHALKLMLAVIQTHDELAFIQLAVCQYNAVFNRAPRPFFSRDGTLLFLVYLLAASFIFQALRRSRADPLQFRIIKIAP
jgi:hypothetical protein